jgi:hypothetical protein
MRTFAAQTTGVSTNDQIKYMANQRQVQNNLAKSGGGVTVPQFRVAGPPTGTDVNSNINGMAKHQLNTDANNQYNSCIGQPSTCKGTVGGSRRRLKLSRSRLRRRRTRRF